MLELDETIVMLYFVCHFYVNGAVFNLFLLLLSSQSINAHLLELIFLVAHAVEMMQVFCFSKRPLVILMKCT